MEVWHVKVVLAVVLAMSLVVAGGRYRKRLSLTCSVVTTECLTAEAARTVVQQRGRLFDVA